MSEDQKLKEFKETFGIFFENFKDDAHSKIVIDYIFQILLSIKK